MSGKNTEVNSINKTPLDVEIDNLIRTLIYMDPKDPEYKEIVANLKTLGILRSASVRQKAETKKNIVTLIASIIPAALSFTEIVLLLKHEDSDVITHRQSFSRIPKTSNGSKVI